MLIFDATQQGVLMEYLKQWSPEVLYLRGEQFNIPVLLASFFRRGSRMNAYADCFIETVCPLNHEDDPSNSTLKKTLEGILGRAPSA